MKSKQLRKIHEKRSKFFKLLLIGLLLALPTLEVFAQSTGNRPRPRPRAGVISTNSDTVICAGDGIADAVNVSVRGSRGVNNWYITDEAGTILVKIRGIDAISPDFEPVGGGICFIYQGASLGFFRDQPVGGNIRGVFGRIRFANRIQITRLTDCEGTVDPGFTPLTARSMSVSGRIIVNAVGGNSSRVLTVSFHSSLTGDLLGTSETRIVTSEDGAEVSAEISLNGIRRTNSANVIVRVRDATNGRTFDRRILRIPSLLP